MRLHFATLTKRKPVPTSAPWISYRGKKSTLFTLAIVHLILWIHFKSISHHSVPFLPFMKPLTLTAALNWKTLWASVCLEMWNKTQWAPWHYTTGTSSVTYINSPYVPALIFLIILRFDWYPTQPEPIPLVQFFFLRLCMKCFTGFYVVWSYNKFNVSGFNALIFQLWLT